MSTRPCSYAFATAWPLKFAAAAMRLFVISALAALGALMPLAHPAFAAQACQAQHTIRRGETLYGIGLKYNMTWDRIAQANNITTPNRIFAGRVLCIPVSGQPQPAPVPRLIPTFIIRQVVRDQSVTIQTANFPAGKKFDVLIGAYGTAGVGGAYVTTTDSGGGGSFSATYTIPAALRGARRLAIRLQSASSYFSYNWFWNSTTN